MSLDPIRKITPSNINPASNAKQPKKIFLSASEVNEETQAQKEIRQGEENNNSQAAKSTVKKSTSSIKNAG